MMKSIRSSHSRPLRVNQGRGLHGRTHAISSLSLPGWLPWSNKEADKRVNIADMQVSRMGLGTWSWGNQLLWGYDESMDEELKRVFDLAISKGVNLFDTADSYGTGRLNGKSELLLGEFIRDQRAKGNASEIHIATKFAAYPWRILPNQIVAACEGSLRRLELDQLSIGQLHWSTSNYAPLQEVALVNGLADCHDKELVRAVGVSNYGPKELRQVHKKFKKRGIDLASAQIQFSLLSYGTEQQEAKEVCDELGVSLISYSPLALGVLSGKYDDSNLPDGPRGFLFKEILPKAQPLLEVLKLIAKERSKTPSQVAIAWCMSKGTIPIPGAKDVNQAEENLGAIGIRLSDGEVRALDEAALKLAKGNKTVMIQNIFQTR